MRIKLVTRRWSIFPNGVGGWYAWNAKEAVRVNLKSGNYVDAWRELEKLQGTGVLFRAIIARRREEFRSLGRKWKP